MNDFMKCDILCILKGKKSVFDVVDWEGWLYRAGLPPCQPEYGHMTWHTV
jgi:hypothetical protein